MVLQVISIELMATILLQQTFGKWLCFILNVLLKLIGLLTKGRSIDITWATYAFLRLEVLMHQVREKATPVKLQLI